MYKQWKPQIYTMGTWEKFHIISGKLSHVPCVMCQQSGILVKCTPFFSDQSLSMLLTVPKWEERHGSGCVSSDQDPECNFVVKDYWDCSLLLLPGQTRAKVSHVLGYFSCAESDQVRTVRSYLCAYKPLSWMIADRFVSDIGLSSRKNEIRDNGAYNCHPAGQCLA